jgi:uncharacterized protein (TIGR02300 family)
MAPNLGVKYACYKCGSKFYDLNKPVPLCPKCGANQREMPKLSPAAERRRLRSKPPEEEKVVPGDDEIEPVVEEEEDEPAEDLDEEA